MGKEEGRPNPVDAVREDFSPFRVFDRDREGHPWESAFEELRRSSDLGRFWVAANWRADHRVPEERETRELGKEGPFGAIADAEDWWEAQGQYFTEETCRPSEAGSSGVISAYLRSPNRHNLVAAPPADFDRLIHVASLNSLLFRVSSGAAAEQTADLKLEVLNILGHAWPFETTLSSLSEDFLRATDGLVRELQVRGEDSIRRLAGLLVDRMGAREPPWWACFSQEVEGLLFKGDGARLCSALGLGHRRDGEWLLIWHYPVADAGPLYRPTVLEAYDSPYHHPSPPGYPLGITMPLETDQPACREVLHRPLHGASAVQWCTGELLRLENFSGRGDRSRLAELRLGHRQRLRREFPAAGLDAWLSRHPEP